MHRHWIENKRMYEASGMNKEQKRLPLHSTKANIGGRGIQMENNPLDRQPLTDMEKQIYVQVSAYLEQKFSSIQNKLDNLEERMSVMEGNVNDLMANHLQQIRQLKNEIESIHTKSRSNREDKSVIIRELKVDTITLDKYEQNNNFGYLGIKEISGQLNIGTTYGSSALPAGIADELIGDPESLEEENEQQEMVNEHDSGADPDRESETPSSHESSNEPGSGHYGRGHSGYFASREQLDHETNHLTEVPIE